MSELIRTFDMKTGKKGKIVGVIVGAVFVVFAVSVMLGMLDLGFLREAWRSSVLLRLVPTRDTAFIYAIIGIVIVVSSLIPDKYSEAKVYSDRFELVKKTGDTESYHFSEISSLNVLQTSKNAGKYIQMVLKAANTKVQIGVSYKSEFPEFLMNTWKDSQRT